MATASHHEHQPSTPSRDEITENDSSISRKDDSNGRNSKRKSSTHYNKISSSNSRANSMKKKNKRKHSRSRERSYSSSSQKEYNDSDKSSISEEGIYAKKILNEKKKKPKNYQYNRDFIPYKQNNYGYNTYQKYNQYPNKPMNNYQYYNNNYNYMYSKNNNQNRMGNMYGRRGGMYYPRERSQNNSKQKNIKRNFKRK